MVGVGSSEDMGLFRQITWNSVVGVELRGRDPLSKLTVHTDSARAMLSLLAKLTFRSGGGSTPSRMFMIKRCKKRTSAVAPRHRLTPSRRSRGSESDNKAASPVGSPSIVVVMGVSGCGKSTI